MTLPADFDATERWLALAIIALDKNRAVAALDNDLVKMAEIDAWFKTHAVAVRPIRDRMEAAEFDRL